MSSSRHIARSSPDIAEPFAERILGGDRKSGMTWHPKIDIGETSAAYLLVAEMPGIDPQDVHIVYEDGFLKLEATRTVRDCGENGWFSAILTERTGGPCHREFTLPEDVDISARRESLVRGLLTISLPKRIDGQVDASDGEGCLPSSKKEDSPRANRHPQKSTSTSAVQRCDLESHRRIPA